MTATISASALRTIATERAGLDALHQAIGNGLAQPFAAAVEMIRAASGRVIVTGMGKSGHWKVADILGLKDRGHLKPGLRADIVRFKALGATPVIATVWSQGRRAF